MKRLLLLAIVALALVTVGLADSAWARKGTPRRVRRYDPASSTAWHAWYYHTAWGMPVALVVPPNVELQTHWGWGVGNTRITKIWHQFERDYPGPGTYDRSMFNPTPRWPSDTDQFGVYYIRGPW